MILEKIKVLKTPRLTAVTKDLGLHEFFSCVICHLSSQKKKKKKIQRNSSALKHAVVNNNKFKMEISENGTKNRQVI